MIYTTFQVPQRSICNLPCHSFSVFLLEYDEDEMVFGFTTPKSASKDMIGMVVRGTVSEKTWLWPEIQGNTQLGGLEQNIYVSVELFYVHPIILLGIYRQRMLYSTDHGKEK